MRLASHEAGHGYGPGYVYVASNEFMPRVVKIGRTEGLVEDRLRELYATGVPGRFEAEGERFFVDCYEGERVVHQAISKLGKRCPNREFYEVERTLAVNILEAMYETQHDRIQPHVFEWQVEEAFESCLSKGDLTSAEHSFNATERLPYGRREELRLRLLMRALLQREEGVAIWLVHSKGVNPDIPIRSPFQGMGIPLYDLTAFEYSILMNLVEFEEFLISRGSDLRNSTVLSLVIDVMINGQRLGESLAKCTKFAICLINRGASIDWPVTANLFSEARRKPADGAQFDFKIWPRDSNLSSFEIAARLAPNDRCFSDVYRAMNRLI
jgi:hypothetical protein